MADFAMCEICLAGANHLDSHCENRNGLRGRTMDDDETPPDIPPSGRTLAYWVALVLKEDLRPKHNIRQSQVAGLLKVDQSTITRFEHGKNLPPDADRYLAAYAQLAQLDDPREIYLMAYDRWVREGAPPLVNEDDETEAQRSARLIAEAAQRHARSRGEKRGTRGETRRKRASG